MDLFSITAVMPTDRHIARYQRAGRSEVWNNRLAVRPSHLVETSTSRATTALGTSGCNNNNHYGQGVAR
jgi:hypothetical protein